MLPASLPETRKDGKETGAAETDLEKFESLSLQRFRGQRGERRAQPLFTEAQGLAPPQGRFWEKDNTHTHTRKNRVSNDSTAEAASHMLLPS